MKHQRLSPCKVAREVFAALSQGSRTFTEIQRKTGRTTGRISDALALLLSKRLIRIENHEDARHYLPASRPRHHSAPAPGPALSFSTLRGLMPHRITTATRTLESE